MISREGKDLGDPNALRSWVCFPPAARRAARRAGRGRRGWRMERPEPVRKNPSARGAGFLTDLPGFFWAGPAGDPKP